MPKTVRSRGGLNKRGLLYSELIVVLISLSKLKTPKERFPSYHCFWSQRIYYITIAVCSYEHAGAEKILSLSNIQQMSAIQQMRAVYPNVHTPLKSKLTINCTSAVSGPLSTKDCGVWNILTKSLRRTIELQLFWWCCIAMWNWLTRNQYRTFCAANNVLNCSIIKRLFSKHNVWLILCSDNATTISKNIASSVETNLHYLAWRWGRPERIWFCVNLVRVNMVDGLFFCATLTGRRGGHTPFVQAGAETSDTGAEAIKPDPGSSWEGHSGCVCTDVWN